MENQILWTAVVTPFNASGEEIDFVSLERLLRDQEKAGNGILLLGSTGEGISLTDAERRTVVTFATQLGLKAPLMVAVPSTQLHQAQEWIAFCKDHPISSYLMPVPLYTKPGIKGQTLWFETLLNQLPAPAMLYNIPSRSGIRLHAETVQNLQSHPRFWSIKDSSGGLDHQADYQKAAPHIKVFCGDDNMMPAMAVLGAAGLVSVAANAWPTATRKYTEICLQNGKLNSDVWWQSSKALFTTSNPVPLKALLHKLRMIAFPTVRLPLSLEDLPTLKALEAAHQDIKAWEQNHA